MEGTVKRSFFTITPFKIGCTIVLAALCLFYSFGNRKPALITTLDNRIIDVLFNLREQQITSGSVVIIDIDDDSLATIGQWPWPRNIVADLATTIHQNGAKAIGFDILFAEMDGTSPKNHLDSIINLLEISVSPEARRRVQDNPALDHDIILGDSLATIPSVLGYVFETRQQGNKEINFPFPSATIRVDPPNTPFSSIGFIEAKNAEAAHEKRPI